MTGIGSTVGVIICNMTLDRIYIKLRKSNNGIGLPEYRIPLVIIGALLMPIAVTLLGWTAQKHWPVELLLFSVGLLGCFMLVAVVPVMAYVVDAFGEYSASALTAVLIARCLASTFLPLAIVPLDDALGYGWGFTVLAAACVVAVPIPVLVVRYGARWRQHSEYSRDA
jgi:MFS family permease